MYNFIVFIRRCQYNLYNFKLQNYTYVLKALQIKTFASIIFHTVVLYE